MKILVLQEDLFRGLGVASRFVSSRAQLPVLSNILFSAKQGKLRLAATNLEMGISYKIGAKVEEEGSVTLPAKLVVELISNMPPGQVSIVEKAGQVIISTPAFSATLSSVPASEFPTVPDEIGNVGFSLPGDVFRSIAQKVAFSAAADEARPSLTGVLLLFGDNLRTVATDGFRLSYMEFPLGKGGKEQKFLVSARAIDELSRILKEGEEVLVSVSEKESQILFVREGLVLTGRLLGGDFPDFEKVIPKVGTHKAIVNKEEFARAVRAASVFAREAASVVRLGIEKDRFLVSAESQQYGKDEVVLEAKTEGEGAVAAFNYRYVLDFLGSIGGDEVSFETEGPTSPGVFKDTKDPSYKHLIMPVRIQS
ncbi:MAG: DNA polymerase III subunit beta [bacterium]|nr:DNA polymerase III subunit beta [bacterium]